MPNVELPGVNLLYNDTGTGTGIPVIFLHAASGTCDSWVHQVLVFREAGYRCIAYDRRNWGRSRPSATGQPFQDRFFAGGPDAVVLPRTEECYARAYGSGTGGFQQCAA